MVKQRHVKLAKLDFRFTHNMKMTIQCTVLMQSVSSVCGFFVFPYGLMLKLYSAVATILDFTYTHAVKEHLRDIPAKFAFKWFSNFR